MRNNKFPDIPLPFDILDYVLYEIADCEITSLTLTSSKENLRKKKQLI